MISRKYALIFRAIGDEFKERFNQKAAIQPNRYEGFAGDGRVSLRDRRITLKADVPQAQEKGFGAADPLAIYKPTGIRQVDAAKAMASFTGWKVMY